MNQTESALPDGFTFAYGAKGGRDCKLCLLEACSIPADILRSENLRMWLEEHRDQVTDHPDDSVCKVRAAFGRVLNDSYPDTAEGAIERTRDLGPLEMALRGTAARGDSAKVALILWDRSLRDWYPRSLETSIALMRAACIGLEKHP